eukprot:jgi/Ulvmu1/8072/UM004_0309.1
MAACVKTPTENGYVGYSDENYTGRNEFLLESVAALNRGLKIAWAGLALLAAALVAVVIALAIVGDRSSCEGSCEGPAYIMSSDAISVLSTASEVPKGYINRGPINGATGSWVTAAQFPAPAAQGISDGSAAVVGEQVYHVGGHVGNANKGNVHSKATFVYDTLTAAFTAGPPLPIAAARGAAASDGSTTLYYTAGVTVGGGHAGADGADCLFALDTSAANPAWTSLPCMSQPRSDHCAAWINGNLYVLGGYSPDYALLDSVEVFDPASETWADAGFTLPSGRGDVQCAVLGDMVYIVGGINTPFDQPPETWFTTEVVAVDVAAKTAALVTQLPGLPRGDLAVAAISPTTMLVAGGEIHAGGRTQVGTHGVFLYDSAAGTWVEKAPMPNAVFRAAAVAMPSHDSTLSFAVFGGHHLCETAAGDAADDDGGCDEISAVRAFIDAALAPTFLLAPDPDVPAVERAPHPAAPAVVVSPLPAITGYRPWGPLSAGGGFWTSKTVLDVARSDFHAHTVGGKIYLVGGLNGRQNGLHHVDVYDPLLDTFTKGPPNSAGRFRLRYASAVMASSIYVVGGLPQNDPVGSDVAKLDTLLIYNTETRNYTQGAPMSGVRSDHCAAVVGTKMYVVGGWDAVYETLRTVEMYDAVTDSWTNGPSLPQPRGDCMAAAYDGVVYVAGGYHDPSGAFDPDNYHQTMYALDTKEKNPVWRPRAPVPVARGDASLVVVRDGRLLLVGGETHARGERTSVATHEVHEYIVRDDVWVAKAPLPMARFRHAAAAYDGAAFIFGGQASSNCDAEGSDCTAVSTNTIQAFFEADSEPMYLHTQL